MNSENFRYINVHRDNVNSWVETGLLSMHLIRNNEQVEEITGGPENDHLLVKLRETVD
jgi:hypothetical protein